MTMTYSRRLLLIITLINLFVLLLAGITSYQGYRQYQDRARMTTQNLVAALESNLIDAIRRADISLLSLSDMHEHERMDDEHLNYHIELVRSRLPEVEAIRITDRDGNLILGTGVDLSKRINLADRSHFMRLRDDPGAGLQLSKPQISRVNNNWVIVLARRTERADGSFNGMIFATVTLEYFTQLFSRLDLGPKGVVFLRDADMGLIARHPIINTPEIQIGKRFTTPELSALLASGKSSGTYISRASPDKTERMLSFRKLEHFPIYAFVGMAAEDYLAPWRSDTQRLAILILLFITGSVYAYRNQHRAWLHQQADHATIERQEALYHELVEDTPVMVMRYQPDASISFANTAFAAFLGTSAGSLVGKRWLDLLPEVSDQVSARKRIDALTPAQPSGSNAVYRMLARDGQTHWTQWTDRAIFDANGRLLHLQSVGEDITERKRSRDIQAARLRLMEYAAEHSVHELLVATLDEAGVLSESPIGFYHFLAPDQKTLALQAWSTRTLQEYCHAEGEGRHYNIDEAGVWVEAIRERRPIIHNDYAALTNKRGLPPGHAVVLREMVIPVFRKGLIVAILGVGNKPTPYTEYDLQTVSLLADLAWDIVEGKRLEAELVEMATTDFLTGLLNRRNFLSVMDNELNRLKRFDIPRAAVLMLDLDHFKRVNDTYGHAAGDAVLKHFAGLIHAELRKVDSGGRLGGEEFAILLLGAELDDAQAFAERLRKTVDDTPLDVEHQRIAITVSIGIAMLSPDDAGPDDALIRADQALYEAKHSGRNRVCCAPSKEKNHHADS